jgi:O-acetyl-ADP-ribose deacetylase (regulator of RNase III)
MEPKANWHNCAVEIHRGDLTQLEIGALVNAANPWLQGGGGVDGAIHRRGGPTIMAECRRIMTGRSGRLLEPGEAVITTAGNLPAKHVIHTVGPVYTLHTPEEAARLLALCYTASLGVLRNHGLRSVAFPCISTGVYGFPPAMACPVAIEAVRDDLSRHGGCDRVVFCVFGETDFRLYDTWFRANADPGVGEQEGR